ncbi:RNA recognition motif domain-containing protein [Mucilaginibacter ginkgonis]|uniref:RNA-binding protein n=1 Tax=Mucilaginibacter ginkgonis TaxID=2682091 RepID=A0A6I4HWJ2_9SPHI|nr:RNA-binding protein [Mucilaginibacter ginkgonis]QQL51206.1 RNA-binding protein [Mucilaginibacter ginkgonis]
MVKLFVGGFPLDIDEIGLAKLFAIHGYIETIKIVRDKKTRLCKGYAFIEMKDSPGAESAVEYLDNYIISGKALTVKISETLQEVSQPKYVPVQKRSFQISEKANEVVRKKRPRRA